MYELLVKRIEHVFFFFIQSVITKKASGPSGIPGLRLTRDKRKLVVDTTAACRYDREEVSRQKRPQVVTGGSNRAGLKLSGFVIPCHNPIPDPDTPSSQIEQDQIKMDGWDGWIKPLKLLRLPEHLQC